MKRGRSLSLVIGILIIFFHPLLSLRAEEGVYSLDVEAEYVEKGDKGLVLVKGEADFPDYTEVFIYFRNINDPDICYRGTKLSVKNSIFEYSIEFRDQKPLAGKYLVEARVVPFYQAREDIRTLLGKRGQNIEKLTEGKLEINPQTNERIPTARFILMVGTEAEEAKVTEEERELLKKAYVELRSLYSSLKDEYTEQQKTYNQTQWNIFSSKWLNKLEALREPFDGPAKIGLKFPKLKHAISNTCSDLFTLRNGYTDNLRGIDYEKRDVGNDTTFSKEQERILSENAKASLGNIKDTLQLLEEETES